LILFCLYFVKLASAVMYLSPRGSQVTAPHQATPQMNLVEIIGTPSDSLLEVVLDKF
jgi:hypothetical protein